MTTKPALYNFENKRWCIGYKKLNIPGHYTNKENFSRHRRMPDGLHMCCKLHNKIYNDRHNKINNPRRYMKYPKDLNCVYRHIDPTTSEVKYIGEGSISRAYEFTSRQMDHGKWFENLLRKGYLPTEIVKVKRYNLTKTESTNLEATLIKLYSKRNLFNKDKYTK